MPNVFSASNQDADPDYIALAAHNQIEPAEKPVRFATTDDVLPFLQGFFTLPLSLFEAGQLLVKASQSNEFVRLTHRVNGRRVDDLPGLVLSLESDECVVYLLCDPPRSGAPMQVHGWAPSRVTLEALHAELQR